MLPHSKSTVISATSLCTILPLYVCIYVCMYVCVCAYVRTGHLVSDFLQSVPVQSPESPLTYCQSVLSEADQYSGFNLITARLRLSCVLDKDNVCV